MALQQNNIRPRRDIRQELADALMERIECGTAPWQSPWDSSKADDTPANAITGKKYRGINRVMLSLFQPNADPRWCTFNQAREKGWQIQKGSHGVTIEKWLTREISTSTGDEGAKNDSEKLHKEKKLGVRYYTVFHASQIEGIPELEPPEAPAVRQAPEEKVESIASIMGVTLNNRGVQAYYQVGTDTITMPNRSTFASSADYDTVLLHEIGHSTGHKSRLNRNSSGTFGSAEYAKEELRAEISAAMNARALGIAFIPDAVNEAERSGIDNSAAYLRSWLRQLPAQGRKTELMAAISEAQRISDYVLGFALNRKEEFNEELAHSASVGLRLKI